MVSCYADCNLCPRRCGIDRTAPSGGEAALSRQQYSYCGESAALRLACAVIHRGEEPPLSGGGGSGTIFVSGCNLGCVFCQNWQISRPRQGGLDQAADETAVMRAQGISPGDGPSPTGTAADMARRPAAASGGSLSARGDSFLTTGHFARSIKPALGRPVSTAEFAEICLALQKRGAENINIVTGSHAVPAIAGGLLLAKAGIPHSQPPAVQDRPEMAGAGFGMDDKSKLTIPVAWNSSASELPETLELLDGLVDIFLPDLKTLDSGLAARYFNAPDYPQTAAAAIRKMLEIAGRRPPPRAAPWPAVIVRHLVLPGHLESTRDVLRWFAENCAGRRGVLLSLMFQYTPVERGALRGPESRNRPAPAEGGAENPRGLERGGDFPPPLRFITPEEYDAVLNWLPEFGIEEGFCQELVRGGTEWLPDFERTNPFPPEMSTALWHWKKGFVK